jgi:hypothetical protein
MKEKGRKQDPCSTVHGVNATSGLLTQNITTSTPQVQWIRLKAEVTNIVLSNSLSGNLKT